MKKRKNSIAILFICSLLFVSACSADEQALFVESTELDFYEQGSVEQTVEQVVDTDGSLAETVVFEETKQLAVHVCGAVRLPGVYELEEGSRVMDAVLAAGGFADDADEEYVNLATVLADGDKVRIPTEQEVTAMSMENGSMNDNGVISSKDLENTGESAQDKININTADAEELCSLPGIGQTRAESILAYRNTHGAFSKIEDIMQVSGIKESSFQKIKDKITVK